MELPYIQDIAGDKPKQEKQPYCICNEIIKGHTCTKRIEVLHHSDTQLNATKVLKYLHISVIFSTFAANYQHSFYECN